MTRSRFQHFQAGQTVFAAIIAALLFLTGCATAPRGTSQSRAFHLEQDTFAFANQLKWHYRVDERSGQMVHEPRQPPADYALHCFPMVRAVRQFHLHAQFDPALPAVSEADYRRRIREILDRPDRKGVRSESSVVIPGGTNLFEFSRRHERLLKEECGGAWRSYAQRGNWRIVIPFTRHQQQGVAAKLAADLREGRLPIVHLATFPKLNHAFLLYSVREENGVTYFAAYDPNSPGLAMTLNYEAARRTFVLPGNYYFLGGDVNVYEVYRNLVY